MAAAPFPFSWTIMASFSLRMLIGMVAFLTSHSLRVVLVGTSSDWHPSMTFSEAFERMRILSCMASLGTFSDGRPYGMKSEDGKNILKKGKKVLKNKRSACSSNSEEIV
jgi:hypothetical protein